MSLTTAINYCLVDFSYTPFDIFTHSLAADILYGSFKDRDF